MLEAMQTKGMLKQFIRKPYLYCTYFKSDSVVAHNYYTHGCNLHILDMAKVATIFSKQLAAKDYICSSKNSYCKYSPINIEASMLGLV